jgi:hypothetical protein
MQVENAGGAADPLDIIAFLWKGMMASRTFKTFQIEVYGSWGRK